MPFIAIYYSLWVKELLLLFFFEIIGEIILNLFTKDKEDHFSSIDYFEKFLQAMIIGASITTPISLIIVYFTRFSLTLFILINSIIFVCIILLEPNVKRNLILILIIKKSIDFLKKSTIEPENIAIKENFQFQKNPLNFTDNQNLTINNNYIERKKTKSILFIKSKRLKNSKKSSLLIKFYKKLTSKIIIYNIFSLSIIIILRKIILYNDWPQNNDIFVYIHHTLDGLNYGWNGEDPNYLGIWFLPKFFSFFLLPFISISPSNWDYILWNILSPIQVYLFLILISLFLRKYHSIFPIVGFLIFLSFKFLATWINYFLPSNWDMLLLLVIILRLSTSNKPFDPLIIIIFLLMYFIHSPSVIFFYLFPYILGVLVWIVKNNNGFSSKIINFLLKLKQYNYILILAFIVFFFVIYISINEINSIFSIYLGYWRDYDVSYYTSTTGIILKIISLIIFIEFSRYIKNYNHNHLLSKEISLKDILSEKRPLRKISLKSSLSVNKFDNQQDPDLYSNNFNNNNKFYFSFIILYIRILFVYLSLLYFNLDVFRYIIRTYYLPYRFQIYWTLSLILASTLVVLYIDNISLNNFNSLKNNVIFDHKSKGNYSNSLYNDNKNQSQSQNQQGKKIISNNSPYKKKKLKNNGIRSIKKKPNNKSISRNGSLILKSSLILSLIITIPHIYLNISNGFIFDQFGMYWPKGYIDSFNEINKNPDIYNSDNFTYLYNCESKIIDWNIIHTYMLDEYAIDPFRYYDYLNDSHYSINNYKDFYQNFINFYFNEIKLLYLYQANIQHQDIDGNYSTKFVKNQIDFLFLDSLTNPNLIHLLLIDNTNFKLIYNETAVWVNLVYTVYVFIPHENYILE